MLLEYYCTDHEIVCCRACISNEHRVCQNVLPLELASKDVKKSALLNDVMEDITHLIATLNALHDNRQSNLQSLEKSKSAITMQIRAVKSKLLKQIDELERELTTSFSSLQRKHEIKINKQQQEISKVLVNEIQNKNEIDFLRDHGSNNQLFISLRQQVTTIHRTEAKIQQMVSNSQEIGITFDEKKDVKIELFGSLFENFKPCQVQYRPKKFQQAQIKTEPTKDIVEFEEDTELKLKTGEEYNILDVSVTENNKLLLTSFLSSDPKIYVYRDCKDYETEIIFPSFPYCVAVIQGTDRAVLTLPYDQSIQFINTTTMTKCDKVNVGFICYGITTGRDRIYVAGEGGTIKTLDTNGKILKTVQQGSDNIYFMAYDDIYDQLIVRCPDKLICTKLDGTLVYSKDFSAGVAGVTRDRQGNIYFGVFTNNNIQRMSSDGKNCEEMLNLNNGISGPNGMCFNNDFTKLFVINNCCTSYKSLSGECESFERPISLVVRRFPMASASFCDPCSEADKSITATKYCYDCKERFCRDCAESHCGFKAFESHHVIDLSFIGSNILMSAKINCHVHSEMLLDYYCTDHEIVCCKACTSNEHQICHNVLPLELASKDVKKSALLNDVMEDITHLITTLNALYDNRQSNLQVLINAESAITKQFRVAKLKLLKRIDDLERGLTANVLTLRRKYETEIIKQKEETSKVLDELKENKNEMDFLKDHGSNNQLFISLRHQVTYIQRTEANIKQIVSDSQEVEIAFDPNEEKIESLWSLSENTKPCQVRYKPRKIQQAQIKTEPKNRIVVFKKDTELKLKTGVYNLAGVSVTENNKLLITNVSSSDPKLYVYRDCKDYETEIAFSSSPRCVAVIPGTDRAVVTLANEKSIQFINTRTIEKGDKVNVGFTCFGIAAGHDIIYVGGEGGIIKILDINGTILKTIKQGSGDIYFMLYNDRHEKLIIRYPSKLLCVQLDGRLVYNMDVSGTAGVTLDRQRNVYFGGYQTNNIQRISSDGNNCKEMLNKDNGIKRPYGMCFNNDFTKLFVINNHYPSVYVYTCTEKFW
ncbi:unnamed protein product [Mytilus coruscus]|uniref:B box-type domain-containing protein n=1 Tax=Mytilus coruscus TaxID=42192 RepID=A0A6J8E088_MYTCO|nr:unnamed protein product [Mytilus coruscus]